VIGSRAWPVRIDVQIAIVGSGIAGLTCARRVPASSRPSGSFANSSATARPIPRFAPVTSAVMPSRSTT
jgi:hypothetical protein